MTITMVMIMMTMLTTEAKTQKKCEKNPIIASFPHPTTEKKENSVLSTVTPSNRSNNKSRVTITQKKRLMISLLHHPSYFLFIRIQFWSSTGKTPAHVKFTYELFLIFPCSTTSWHTQSSEMRSTYIHVRHWKQR